MKFFNNLLSEIKLNILKVKIFKKFFIKLKLAFFLLRLIFTNKNKIRYQIFDSMNLKKFLIDDSWTDTLDNNPPNNPVDSFDTDNNTAVLIPGRLRCWAKSKDLIYSIAKKTKVFIVTDLTDEKIIDTINHENIITIIVEKSVYKDDFSKISNVFLSQYFKLKCAIDEVYRYEKNNSVFFKNFLKLRTDFFYFNSEKLLDMSQENNQNNLFAFSDLCFSGRREFFLPLKSFYDFAEWSYVNDFHNLDYMPINPTQIINSDPGATRFNWLKYPSEIVETTDSRPSGEYIQKKIIKNYDNALKYKFKINDEFKSTGGKGFFASEQCFSLFLNLAGIPCKTHFKYAGYIMNYPNKIKKDGFKEGTNKYREDMEAFNNK
jgi:hypothetical protein